MNYYKLLYIIITIYKLLYIYDIYIHIHNIYIYSCYRTVPSAIWEIFSEFLVFCNLFHERLGE